MSLNMQKGFISSGAMAIIVLLGVIIILTIKVIPVYLTDYSISTILSSLHHDANMEEDHRGDSVIKQLKTGLDTNDIKLSGNELGITRSGGKIMIIIIYERRISLFFNCSLALMFAHEKTVYLSEG